MHMIRKFSIPLFTALFSLLILSGCSGSGSSDTSSSTDTDHPPVTSTAPADGATEVGTNTKVVAFFDGAMNPDTITQSSFTLKGEGEAAIDTSKVTYDADTHSATLEPNGGLASSKLYTATFTTSVKNDNNVALTVEFTWSFTTGAAADITAPTVESSSPADGATGVTLNTEVGVVFSEAIDPATLTSDSFKLTKDTGGTVAGTLKYTNPNTVVLTPDSNLDTESSHTLTLNTALTDLAGNPLAQVTIGFKTGTEIASGPEKVQLGTAENYVLLAKTGISTTGATAITGDIAVSPGSRTTLTGFDETMSTDTTYATSSHVTGKLFAASMSSPTPSNLTTAVSNMETAYTNAAGRSDPDFSNKGAGEIGGLTLEPGLYNWGTGVTVTNDVTLNGGANDVWIFQISKSLVLQDGASVVLTGGAIPENIFWQVAEGVTLKAGATLNGVVLSKTGVDLLSGAVLNGRGLAQSAVTLDGNEIK